MRTRSMRFGAALVAVTLVAGLSGFSADAVAADPLCTVSSAVTNTAAGDHEEQAAVSADGSRIAFISDQNLTGGNADGNKEVFLYNTVARSTTQVTTTTGGNTNPPVISADGSKIAFVSDINIAGQNPDLNYEVYVWNSAGPVIDLAASSTGVSSDAVAISGDGTRVAFRSNRNVSAQNPDGNEEIFVYRTDTFALTQLTNTTGAGNGRPDLSADGTRVTFDSDRFIGANNADGNTEIWLWTSPGPAVNLTNTTGGDTSSPSMSDDGTRIAFTSDQDFDGTNADGNTDVWVHDTTLGSNQTQAATVTADGFNDEATISREGTRIAFRSDRNITGDNPGETAQVFVHDTDVEATAQVTRSAGGVNQSANLSADGTTVTFSSDQPYLSNGDGNIETFIGSCGSNAPTFSDVPTSNVFFDQVEWMAAARVASGFPDGTFKPQDGVKRQQMANFLYNLADQPPFVAPLTPTFTDYPLGSTFYKQVEWMAAEEIASGFPDDTFRPQEPVKRQQMAAFLYNLAGRPEFDPPVTPTFTDVPVSSPFYAEVEWMAAEEIASGFPGGTFKPKDPVKRQQMANFLYNLASGVGVDLD